MTVRSFLDCTVGVMGGGSSRRPPLHVLLLEIVCFISGSRKLVHVSCGSQCVWGLDETGHVYLRMGVAFTENHVTMCPVWLPLEPNNLLTMGGLCRWG